MVIACIGSHSVGKTSVIERLKRARPELGYFQEAIRHQTRAFGFRDPFEACGRYGVGAFQLMNMNSWSVIDPAVNPGVSSYRHVIIDRSTLDQFGYYLALRSRPLDFELEPMVKAMAKHYLRFIDLFVYFPIGVIPLVGDDMRPDDPGLQCRVDEAIKRAMIELMVSPNRVHHLKSVTIEDRVREVLDLIPA